MNLLNIQQEVSIKLLNGDEEGVIRYGAMFGWMFLYNAPNLTAEMKKRLNEIKEFIKSVAESMGKCEDVFKRFGILGLELCAENTNFPFRHSASGILEDVRNGNLPHYWKFYDSEPPDSPACTRLTPLKRTIPGNTPESSHDYRDYCGGAACYKCGYMK